MPVDIIDRYELRCLNCGYAWKTKYSKVSAICPSCKKRVYNNQYQIIQKYSHSEFTSKEISEGLFVVVLTILIVIALLFARSGVWIGFFIFLLIVVGFTYFYIQSNKK